MSTETQSSQCQDLTLFAKISDFCAWFGAWLFLSGGVTLKGVFDLKPAVLEINQWGLAFLPLAVLLIARRSEWRDLSFVRVMHRLWPLLGRKHSHVFLLISVGCMHFAAMMARHYSFQSEWDLSIYANACANGLHSSLRNHKTLLADHFEPGLFAFVPLCKAVGPVPVLLAAQCIAWVIGSFGVHKIAKSLDWNLSLATIVSALYLLFSGHQTISYYDFHLYALSLGTVPWLIYSALQSNYFILMIVSLIHLSLKENTGLFLSFFGLWLMLGHSKRWGAALALTGAATFAGVLFFAMPFFRDGQPSEYFGKYYSYLGSSPLEILKTLVQNPLIIANELFKTDKFLYLLKIFAPFAFVHFLKPTSLIPILPPLAIGMLSNSYFMHSANFHYEAEIFPWLFVSALLISNDEIALSRWRQITTKVLRLLRKENCSVTVTPRMALLGTIVVFFSGSTPKGRLMYYMPSKPQLEMASKLNELSTTLRNCRVATVERLSSHLASIPQLTMLNEHESANAVVVGYPQGDRFWIQSLEKIENEYVPLWNTRMQSTTPIPSDRDFRVWKSEDK